MKFGLWVAAGCSVLAAASCSGEDKTFGKGGAGSAGESAAGVPGAGGAASGPTNFAGEAGAQSLAGTGGTSVGAGGSEALGGAGQEGGNAAELAPPPGAFAWYKATADDVTTVSANLADGNDFIKSFWEKTNLNAQALQPGVDGDMTATALNWSGIDQGSHTLKHVLTNSSYAASKTVRVRARMGERRYLWLGGPAVVANQAPTYTVFDLQDGVVVGGPGIAAKMTPLKNLWYECEATIMSGPAIWITIAADSYRTDTGGPATTKPLVWVEHAEVEQTVVTAWKDRIGGRDFLDASGGWSWLPASASFKGLPALQAFYLYGPALRAGAAKDWTFLHDGTGGTIVLLQQQALPSKAYPHSLVSEYDAANEGVHLGVSSSDSKQWEYSVTNAAGKAVFSLQGGDTTGVSWLLGSYGTSQQPQAQFFQDGALLASANPSIKPAMTSGNLPLTLGGAYGPSQLVHEVLVYDRTLKADELGELKAYFSAELAP